MDRWREEGGTVWCVDGYLCCVVFFPVEGSQAAVAADAEERGEAARASDGHEGRPE